MLYGIRASEGQSQKEALARNMSLPQMVEMFLAGNFVLILECRNFETMKTGYESYCSHCSESFDFLPSQRKDQDKHLKPIA